MTAKDSDLWVNIAQSLFGHIDDSFIETLRAPGGTNRRLAAWDPYDRSTRYYKFLLFHIARQKLVTFFDANRQLRNTTLGKPTFVTV